MTQKRFGRLVGESPRMRHVFRLIQQAAEVDTPVLITGEASTGKELVAREVHRRSSRMDGPFVCARAGGLAQAEQYKAFFQRREGTSRNMRAAQDGFMEQARRGTLYIPELETLAAPVQEALKRCVEEGAYAPPGLPETFPVRARIILCSITHDEEAMSGLLGAALRCLPLGPIPVPALRERAGDIEMLAEAFLEDLASQHGVGVERISAAAYSALRHYPWPGNLGELQRVLASGAAAAGGGVLRPEHLPAPVAVCVGALEDVPADSQTEAEDGDPEACTAHPGAMAGHHGAGDETGGMPTPAEGVFIPLGKTFDEAMHAYATLTLRHYGQNKTKAAQVLGVSRKTLYERLSRWEKGLYNES